MKQKRNLERLKLLLISSIVLTVCAGCNTTSVYVLDQQELVRVKSGDKIEAKFDGWLLSQRAVERVMNAKVEQQKLK
jgi:hypothetical protein